MIGTQKTGTKTDTEDRLRDGYRSQSKHRDPLCALEFPFDTQVCKPSTGWTEKPVVLGPQLYLQKEMHE